MDFSNILSAARWPLITPHIKVLRSQESESKEFLVAVECAGDRQSSNMDLITRVVIHKTSSFMFSPAWRYS